MAGSVRDYAINEITPGRAAAGATVGGGNALVRTSPHALDGPEHTVAADATRLNASTDAHGLLPKLSGNEEDALRGDGSWGSVGIKEADVLIIASYRA